MDRCMSTQTRRRSSGSCSRLKRAARAQRTGPARLAWRRREERHAGWVHCLVCARPALWSKAGSYVTRQDDAGTAVPSAADLCAMNLLHDELTDHLVAGRVVAHPLCILAAAANMQAYRGCSARWGEIMREICMAVVMCLSIHYALEQSPGIRATAPRKVAFAFDRVSTRTKSMWE
jgi:hypothetical protein